MTQTQAFRQIFWQTWSDIVFVHWAMDPAAISALLPPELEPELFEGRAYVGLVPFRMSGIRPVCFPAVPGLSSTLETNVRTYVKRRGVASEPIPAVWFFSLEAQSSLAIRLARWAYGLPYFKASMDLTTTYLSDGSRRFLARSVRKWPTPVPATSLVEAQFSPNATATRTEPGTLEHFLVERYALYALRNKRLVYAQVRHAPYQISSGRLIAVDTSLVTAAGLPAPPRHESALVHRAEELRVKIGVCQGYFGTGLLRQSNFS